MSDIKPMPKSSAIYLHWMNALTTFSYAILFSSLALYLTNQLKLSHEDSNGIVSFFLATNFALHLIGGYIGGRLLSNRLLFVTSVLFQIIGIYILSLSNLKHLLWGLSFFLVGCGFNSTCLYCMLTQQFIHSDNNRESAFFINYCAMNIGFFLGFLASGYFDIIDDYQTLFNLSNFINIIIIILLIFSWKRIDDKDTPLIHTKKTKANRFRIMGYLITFFIIPIILIGFKQVQIANNVILMMGVGALLFILFFAISNKNDIEKNNIYAFLILTLSSIVFWMLFYVGPMGITHFLKNNVNITIFNYRIPPQWIMNLNSIFVIAGSPLLAFLFNKLRNKGLLVSISRQFFLSLISIAISFYFLSLGILYASNSGFTSSIWVILHFLTQAIGELLIAPVGYAMIGKLAPSNLQGFMMGTWMMVSGISAALSHHFSNIMTKAETTNPLISNPDYLATFNQLGLYALIAAIILIVISPKLDKLIKGESDKNREDLIYA